MAAVSAAPTRENSLDNRRHEGCEASEDCLDGIGASHSKTCALFGRRCGNVGEHRDAYRESLTPNFHRPPCIAKSTPLYAHLLEIAESTAPAPSHSPPPSYDDAIRDAPPDYTTSDCLARAHVYEYHENLKPRVQSPCHHALAPLEIPMDSFFINWNQSSTFRQHGKNGKKKKNNKSQKNGASNSGENKGPNKEPEQNDGSGDNGAGYGGSDGDASGAAGNGGDGGDEGNEGNDDSWEQAGLSSKEKKKLKRKEKKEKNKLKETEKEQDARRQQQEESEEVEGKHKRGEGESEEEEEERMRKDTDHANKGNSDRLSNVDDGDSSNEADNTNDQEAGMSAKNAHAAIDSTPSTTASDAKENSPSMTFKKISPKDPHAKASSEKNHPPNSKSHSSGFIGTVVSRFGFITNRTSDTSRDEEVKSTNETSVDDIDMEEKDEDPGDSVDADFIAETELKASPQDNAEIPKNEDRNCWPTFPTYTDEKSGRAVQHDPEQDMPSLPETAPEQSKQMECIETFAPVESNAKLVTGKSENKSIHVSGSLDAAKGDRHLKGGTLTSKDKNKKKTATAKGMPMSLAELPKSSTPKVEASVALSEKSPHVTTKKDKNNKGRRDSAAIKDIALSASELEAKTRNDHEIARVSVEDDANNEFLGLTKTTGLKGMKVGKNTQAETHGSKILGEAAPPEAEFPYLWDLAHIDKKRDKKGNAGEHRHGLTPPPAPDPPISSAYNKIATESEATSNHYRWTSSEKHNKRGKEGHFQEPNVDLGPPPPAPDPPSKYAPNEIKEDKSNPVDWSNFRVSDDKNRKTSNTERIQSEKVYEDDNSWIDAPTTKKGKNNKNKGTTIEAEHQIAGISASIDAHDFPPPAPTPPMQGHSPRIAEMDDNSWTLKEKTNGSKKKDKVNSNDLRGSTNNHTKHFPKEETAAKSARSVWGAIPQNMTSHSHSTHKDRDRSKTGNNKKSDGAASLEDKQPLINNGKASKNSRGVEKIADLSECHDTIELATGNVASPSEHGHRKEEIKEVKKTEKKEQQDDAWSFWGSTKRAGKKSNTPKDEVEEEPKRDSPDLQAANRAGAGLGVVEATKTVESQAPDDFPSTKPATSAAKAILPKSKATPKSSLVEKIKAFEEQKSLAQDKIKGKDRANTFDGFSPEASQRIAELAALEDSSEEEPIPRTGGLGSSHRSNRRYSFKGSRVRGLSPPVEEEDISRDAVPGGFPDDIMDDDIDDSAPPSSVGWKEAAAKSGKKDKKSGKKSKQSKSSKVNKSSKMDDKPPEILDVVGITQEASNEPEPFDTEPYPEKFDATEEVDSPTSRNPPTHDPVERPAKKEPTNTVKEKPATSGWGFWGSATPAATKEVKEDEHTSEDDDEEERVETAEEETTQERPHLSRTRSTNAPPIARDDEKDRERSVYKISGSDKEKQIKSRPLPTSSKSMGFSLFGAPSPAKPKTHRRASNPVVPKSSRSRHHTADPYTDDLPPSPRNSVPDMSPKAAKVMGTNGVSRHHHKSLSSKGKERAKAVTDPYAIDGDDVPPPTNVPAQPEGDDAAPQPTTEEIKKKRKHHHKSEKEQKKPKSRSKDGDSADVEAGPSNEAADVATGPDDDFAFLDPPRKSSAKPSGLRGLFGSLRRTHRDVENNERSKRKTFPLDSEPRHSRKESHRSRRSHRVDVDGNDDDAEPHTDVGVPDATEAIPRSKDEEDEEARRERRRARRAARELEGRDNEEPGAAGPSDGKSKKREDRKTERSARRTTRDGKIKREKDDYEARRREEKRVRRSTREEKISKDDRDGQMVEDQTAERQARRHRDRHISEVETAMNGGPVKESRTGRRHSQVDKPLAAQSPEEDVNRHHRRSKHHSSHRTPGERSSNRKVAPPIDDYFDPRNARHAAPPTGATADPYITGATDKTSSWVNSQIKDPAEPPPITNTILDPEPEQEPDVAGASAAATGEGGPSEEELRRMRRHARREARYANMTPEEIEEHKRRKAARREHKSSDDSHESRHRHRRQTDDMMGTGYGYKLGPGVKTYDGKDAARSGSTRKNSWFKKFI